MINQTKIKTKKRTTKKDKELNDSLAVISEKAEKDIKVLKNEVHYYKGVAIMTLTLIFCVFIAFSSLFASMYLETKATRVLIGQSLDQIITRLPADSLSVENSLIENDEFDESDNDISADWKSFNNFGYTVFYPETWTSRIDTIRKVVHFYWDGTVRSDKSIENGELRIFIKNSNEYLNLPDMEIEDIRVGDTIGMRYDFSKNGNDYVAVVVPQGDKFVEFLFRTVKSGEVLLGDTIIEEILNKFTLNQ